MKDKLSLDEALAFITEVAHGHQAGPLARKHLAFAAAHIWAAWLDMDGQKADQPDQTHFEVAFFYKLNDMAEAKARAGKGAVL